LFNARAPACDSCSAKPALAGRIWHSSRYVNAYRVGPLLSSSRCCSGIRPAPSGRDAPVRCGPHRFSDPDIPWVYPPRVPGCGIRFANMAFGQDTRTWQLMGFSVSKACGACLTACIILLTFRCNCRLMPEKRQVGEVDTASLLGTILNPYLKIFRTVMLGSLVWDECRKALKRNWFL